MAVYRESKRIRPLGLALAGVIVALLIVVAIFVIRGYTPGAAPDPLAGARAKALEAAQGLEVLTIEYPQAAQGAELTGVIGGLARAQSAFESSQSALAQVDPAAVEQIAAEFAALNNKVAARAPAEEVLPLAETARARLLALAKAE